MLRAGTRAATRTMVVHLGPLPAPAGGPAPSAVGPLPGSASGPARAGFIVGRSVGGSVTRNRVTRRLRHLVAPRLHDLPAGVGLVVRALPAAADATSEDLARDLASGLRRCVRSRGLGQHPVTAPEVSQ